MYTPSAKSLSSLIGLFVISIVLMLIVENSRVFKEEENYESKLNAAKQMKKAELAIKEFRDNQGFVYDELNDPNKTGLIGEQNTVITTDRGDVDEKLTSLNPNFAAIIIDYFKELELKEGDEVAVSLTGSNPALNIAVYSAIYTMKLKPVIITSLGSSMFGANDPEFTWLDMERVLNEKGVFDYKSIAASLGGGRDIGRGLNRHGRFLLASAIERNNVEFIKEKSLTASIEKKSSLFDIKNHAYKAYINIGGGLSSIGTSVNAKLLKPGINKFVKFNNLKVKGTLFHFGDSDIPVLHLFDIKAIADRYQIPSAPDVVPEPGEGTMFKTERYNLVTASISLAILSIMILVVIVFDRKQMKLRESEVNRIKDKSMVASVH
ncbi:MAG: poly-gamma-glutamate system protein [Candidatus Delongbacteria bacterium]|nr:poly-gamma-glutamate system protein [Candidatus Delongbacteria bacterium]MBN2834735.1 poly-gamma-glutamate system protein [Candidatus Delongbacteria bacterium]